MNENKPMQQRPQPPCASEGNPRFGRLLLVLALVVALIVLIVAASLAWVSA